MMSVPVMSAGIRSGVNWIRLKLKIQNLGESLDQERLGKTRDARNHRMGPDHQRNHDLIDHVILGNDHFSEFFQKASVSCPEFFNQLRITKTVCCSVMCAPLLIR